MKYITGIPALNLKDPVLGTFGDWHQSCIDWVNVPRYESQGHPLGDWGIQSANVPCIGTAKTANHIRACIDLLIMGQYGNACGMRRDYIDDERYTPLIFELVSKLHPLPNWLEIDEFMNREYLCDWIEYKEKHDEYKF